MSKFKVTGAVIATAAILSSGGYAQTNGTEGTISVSGKQEKDYPNLAKISMVEAIETANAEVPGKAVEADLDDERNFLVYEVKIVTDDGNTQKVVVDAGEKRVLWKETD